MGSSSTKCSLLLSFLVLLLFLHGLCCYGEVAEDAVVAPMKRTEQEALYSAIQGFVGNWWNGSDLFPDPCGWTPIQGVSCDIMDGFWYVTNLNFGPVHDNSLTCAQNPVFRPQIFELSHLKSLSFIECFTNPRYMITLPNDKWRKLARTLESLELRSNPSLVGLIPSVFGELWKLESLVLIENGFSGELPVNIGSLGDLKRLVLSGNKFTGSIPDNLGNLTELLILDMSRNSLSGCLPSSIGYLRSLLKLDLSNNNLTGNIPREIANLKNLTLLDLRNNSFSGGLTSSFENMLSLQELVLSDNPIGGDLKNVDWPKMQNLMILDLSSLGLTGEVPKSMSKPQKLRYVGLGNNHLTGNLPPEFSTMPSVSTVYVNGNNLTGELALSEAFYRRLGRRFGAWDNPNLCYRPVPLSSEYTPTGVEPCKSDVILSDPVLKLELVDQYGSVQQQQQPQLNGDRTYDINSFSGLTRNTVDDFWWIFLLEGLMMILLWNCFS